MKANPIAWDAQKRYEDWDRKMLEKKRNQKLLKQRLMEETINKADSKLEKGKSKSRQRK